MSQHLSPDLLERYRQRQVTPAELLSIGEHLRECETCRQCSQSFNQNMLPYPGGQLQTTAHLSDETLFLFAEGRLEADTRLATEEHLTECRQCCADALALRAHVAREEILAQAVNTPPIIAPVLAQTRTARWLAWWSDRMGLAARPWALGLGTTALLLLGLGAGWFFFKAPPEPAPLVQQNQQQNAQPPVAPPDGYQVLAATDEDGSAKMGGPAGSQAERVKVFYKLEGKRVRLRWSLAPAGTEYDVSVNKADYSGNICRAKVSGLEYFCPDTLPPGSYRVQVLPLKGGERQPEAAGKGVLKVD